MLQDFPSVLAYLYSRLPMFTRVGAIAIKKDLDNTLALCEALGNPYLAFPSIHIAGTNGKGSTSSMMAAIFQAAGYKTGLYTSPHLKSFTERIRVNGQEMSELAVVDFVQKNQALIEKIEPSFFEVTVAMAFDYFAKEKVDIAIIEVGLGGRLDSTNVITPELSIITNISFDHTDLLGDTLAKIAFEKAGIIKANIPVVIGEKNSETAPVFLQKAQECQSEIYFAEDNFTVKNLHQSWEGQDFEVTTAEGITHFHIDLSGYYQAKNLYTVLQSVKVLQNSGWKITQKHLESALSSIKKSTGLKGRMMCLQEKPLTLCDVGHNEAGIQFVMQQLAEKVGEKPLHIVWGMVKDKNHSKVLALLPKDAHYYFVCPDIPRGLAANEMQAIAADLGLKGNAFESVQKGLEAAQKNANIEDIIFVGGSTFVVAEVV